MYNNKNETIKHPLVSVIVLTWNSLENIHECLYSLISSNYPNFNIIIVDNGSFDRTIEYVRFEFPEVSIIENKSNRGFTGGNNIGILQAIENKSDYIFLVNDDTCVLNDTLLNLVNIGENNDDIGILCPKITSFHNREMSYVGAVINWLQGIGCEIEQDSDEILSEVVLTDYAPGCALLIKTHVVNQIGMLDDDYFAYCEDTDWSVRCKKAGYLVAVVTGATIYHKGTLDQSQHKSDMATFYLRRNQLLFMRKHSRWFYWPSFVKNYSRSCLLQFAAFQKQGEIKKADAVLDGVWSGLSGAYGANRATAPLWFRSLIDTRIEFWLWFTGLFFAWGYYKKKIRSIIS